MTTTCSRIIFFRRSNPLSQVKQLETLTIPAQIKEIEFLRQLPSLKRIGFSEATLEPAEEFWKKHAARKN